MKARNEILVAHVPVVSQGYLDFFRDANVERLVIPGLTILSELPDLRKDIRALRPETAQFILESCGLFDSVIIAESESFKSIVSGTSLIAPRDDVTEYLRETFPDEFIDSDIRPVFLRWDRESVQKKETANYDRSIDAKDIDPTILKTLEEAAGKSSDWWRRVSAILFFEKNEGKPLVAHNQHLPTSYTPEIDGDPRMYGSRGKLRDATTAMHAEAEIIAKSAHEGKSLKGANLFVSTFPCPTCAKLIARSGIKQVLFLEGYAMIDGYRILQDYEVEVTKINGHEFKTSDPSVERDYPEKAN